MTRTRAVIAIALGVAIALGAPTAPDAKRWWSHILFLADDKLEGRETGSEGHRQAAAYVAGEFERSGLKPAGTQGYLQPVKLHSRRILEEQSSLALLRGGEREPLTLGEDASNHRNISRRPWFLSGTDWSCPN